MDDKDNQIKDESTYEKQMSFRKKPQYFETMFQKHKKKIPIMLKRYEEKSLKERNSKTTEKELR